MPYDPKTIERKWQAFWEERQMYRAPDFPKKKKRYVLDMFPYPSGEGLHVGHVEGYTATDVISRYFRMRGEDVLHPMGWDAFGLPAENYAIQTKTHPTFVVERNIARFREQLKRMGFSYDWSREINTTDPAYYRWTQWIFLKLFERGLAYEAEAPINFCPKDKTGLANEEVVDGKCDRCGTVVERRMLRQWMLKITAYAERLLSGLDELSWPERIKEMQRNWIGRSEGAEVLFEIVPHGESNAERGKPYDLWVFTTRPDTLFGATYVVLAPEHPFIEGALQNPQSPILNLNDVRSYVEKAKQKSELERQGGESEKSGVRLEGVVAINPVNDAKLPVFVADYVLGHYGTGAIMAVPAHDERDFAFAKRYGLPVTIVICPHEPEKTCPILTEAYLGEGHLVGSGQFDGMPSEEARDAIVAWLAKQGKAKKVTHYKLRDWIFSRQRFWGEPIPLVFCERCRERAEAIRASGVESGNSGFSKGELLNPGWIAVPEDELPVTLPDVEHYEPTGTGESPLATITDWVQTTCPKCGGPAKRETNTMPQWAGSCWYYLRFIDPHNDERFVNAERERAWMPVDLYVGGAEHAVLHLLYARFWHMVLYDEGLVSTQEPFARLVNQGIILGPDNQKMSKSRGNIINPDEVIEAYGADTLRLYELFMGPLESEKPWDTRGIIGIWRFLNKVYAFAVKTHAQEDTEQRRRVPPRSPLSGGGVQRGSTNDIERMRHRVIKKVTEDIEAMKFNTALSALMEYLNELSKHNAPRESDIETLLLLLAPFAPHLAEELWHTSLNRTRSIHEERWPSYDPTMVVEENVTIAIQVNGKLRGEIAIRRGATEDEVRSLAENNSNIARYLSEGTILKVIFVPDRLMNFVVRTTENEREKPHP
jgi:leucyl-tRNA synthetase